MATKSTTQPTGQAFAIIATGGKQYKVAAGDVLSVEKLPETTTGGKVVFDKVMLVDDGTSTKVGAPYVAGATVNATVVEEGKGKKVLVVRYLPKSRYFKKNGHRQPFTKVKIESIA